MLGVTLRWTHIPSRGGVEIFSVASSYRNPDKLQPGGPLGSHADFNYFFTTSTAGCDKGDHAPVHRFLILQNFPQ